MFQPVIGIIFHRWPFAKNKPRCAYRILFDIQTKANPLQLIDILPHFRRKQLVGLTAPFVLAFDRETRKMIVAQKALLDDVAQYVVSLFVAAESAAGKM
jgi:hypothetical protein